MSSLGTRVFEQDTSSDVYLFLEYRSQQPEKCLFHDVMTHVNEQAVRQTTTPDRHTECAPCIDLFTCYMPPTKVVSHLTGVLS